jgi:glycosyltransferase involved in cell wall biosynthesis
MNVVNKVGIYRTVYPYISEAFITEQISAMKRYEPVVIMRKRLKEITADNIAISDYDFFGLKQKIFTLTRAMTVFPKKEIFSSLKLIHAHFGPDGVYAMSLAVKLGIPFIVTFHGFDITMSRKSLWLSKSPTIYQFLLHENELKKKCSVFLADSGFIRHKLIENRYPEEKIIQHYIGVDTQKFIPVNNKGNDRYILSVGRHVAKKGIDTLLRAFARIASKHPDVMLFQIGTGDMTDSLQSLSNILGIGERVRFLGAQPHASVRPLMQCAEIFCLPSQTADDGDSEALGIVFNEASSCGIPVVATWHGGIPEAVIDGETGLLVPEKDDGDLADKLDNLLSDRELGRKMGRRGREYVCEIFDVHKQTAKLEAIYDTVLQGASKH